MLSTQTINKKYDKDKVKDDIANLISNLIDEIDKSNLEYDNRIIELNLEKIKKKEDIIKKYSHLYHNYFN